MNFSDFCEKNSNENPDTNFDKNLKNLSKIAKNSQNFGQNSQNFNNFYTDEQKKDIENKLFKYQNMSKSDLMQELISETNKQKQNGNLDSKKLDEIKNTILPILNQEEAKRLEDLVKMLK